jgi:23S rRNA (uracil1939-C5)-methyltransferase
VTVNTHRQSLAPGDEVVVGVEKAVAGGRMLARHQGQVVFVAGAIPGERVRVRVERVSKQLAYAEVVDVSEPSPDRRPSNIGWACAGSVYAHIAYPRQLALKSELVTDAFARIGKITLPGPTPVIASDEQGYRMRARLHAQGGRFGFFREGTHELCDAAATTQLLDSTVAALEQLQTTLTASGVKDVISCEIAENIPASERVVLLELGDRNSSPLHVDAIEGVTGLAFTDQMKTRLMVAYGSPYAVDRIDMDDFSVDLRHHVQSFFQGNRHLLRQLVERVLARADDGDVTDLYAGVGLFAVALAASGRTGIVAVEGNQWSARDLEANAAPFGHALAVEHAAVERYLQRRDIRRPQTLILDPPRTGMSREAMAGILRIKPPRIVYVSCDLATVARDVRRFLDEGYRLAQMEAFDLFPNTAHVETLVMLTR